MNEAMKKNIWADKNIPAIEYCKLERSAELLGCHINDLLHWAEINAIQLCLKIDWMPAVIETYNTNDSYLTWLNKQLSRKGLLQPSISFSKSSNFTPSVIMADPNTSDLIYTLGNATLAYDIQRSDEGLIYGHAEGLWCFFVRNMNYNIYEKLANHHSVTFEFLDLAIHASDREEEPDFHLSASDIKELDFFGGENEDLFIEENLPDIITLTKNDLYISRKQIEYIYTNKGRVMDSIVTGDKTRPIKDLNKIEESIKNKRKAPKKEALIQQLMILNGVNPDTPLKTLLALLGITQEKQRAYSETQLHRAVSKLLSDAPLDADPKTLARWLKEEGAR